MAKIEILLVKQPGIMVHPIRMVLIYWTRRKELKKHKDFEEVIMTFLNGF